MLKAFSRFWRDESGATAVEYALLVSLAGLMLFVSIRELGSALATAFLDIAGAVERVALNMR